MIAVVSIGDCEVMILRRLRGRQGPLEAVFHTEMQRIDGHVQTPLQLARVDGRIDPDFHDGITIEVIEKGSAVHCVSAYEGDIIIMGSDGVFDNLFLDEIADLANSVLQPGRQIPTVEALLGHLAKRIVQACHSKTQPGPNGILPEAPIGRGGKMDDTSCVVAEVIEWTDAHSKAWAPRNHRNQWQNFMTCGSGCAASDDEVDGYDDEMMPPGHPSKTPRSGISSRGERSYVTDGEEVEEDERGCSIA